MIRADRDRLIERYMNGQMTQAEEEAFFINAAVNPELRQELKAHRLVETAVRKDRDGLTAGHAALRNRVAATLTSSPAPVMEPAAAQGGMMVERVLGAVAAHPSVTAIIVGIIAIGTVMLQPWGSTENIPANTPPAAVQTTPPPTTQQRNGGAERATQPHATTAPAGAAITQPSEASNTVGNAVRNAPTPATTTTNRSAGNIAKQKEARGHDGSHQAATANSAAVATDASSANPLPAIAKPDSINVGINIDLKQPAKPQ